VPRLRSHFCIAPISRQNRGFDTPHARSRHAPASCSAPYIHAKRRCTAKNGLCCRVPNGHPASSSTERSRPSVGAGSRAPRRPRKTMFRQPPSGGPLLFRGERRRERGAAFDPRARGRARARAALLRRRAGPLRSPSGSTDHRTPARIHDAGRRDDERAPADWVEANDSRADREDGKDRVKIEGSSHRFRSRGARRRPLSPAPRAQPRQQTHARQRDRRARCHPRQSR
jgi:hypothetical protein